jgi:hypothetical protein
MAGPAGAGRGPARRTDHQSCLVHGVAGPQRHSGAVAASGCGRDCRKKCFPRPGPCAGPQLPALHRRRRALVSPVLLLWHRPDRDGQV